MARFPLLGLGKHCQAEGLRKNPITDVGLERLATMEQLIYLNLWNTRITDSGLWHLARLQRLDDIEVFEEARAWKPQ